VIRIRPGRSWRHNPGYLGELRALTAPRARSYGFGGILDVVGLEVDGVDIAAGVGETPLLHTLDELTQALIQLCEGAGAAQATVGPGPTEVVLEPRGADVLLTLCTLRTPSRVLAGGLLVDASRLRTAALHAARGVLRDLLDISPALSEARLLRRLGRACALLARASQKQAAPWPGDTAAATPGFVARGGKAKVTCEVQVTPDAAARLAAARAVPDARLAPLLGRGTLALRLPGAPALSLEGPPFLLLRDLLREAAALVQAWESGERSFSLRLGAVDLACDLTRDEARAKAFSEPAHASAVQIASALAGAARAFAERALELAGSGLAAGTAAAPDEPLADLLGGAAELLDHCRDLSSGDLRRAPEAVPAPAPRALGAPQTPLSTGRLRRLVFRETFRAQLSPAPEAIWFASIGGGGVLLAQGGGQLSARDAATARPLWQRDLAPARGSTPLVQDGSDLFVELREKGAGATLARLDASTGAARFRRRMRGRAASLHKVPGGVVCALDEGAWALVSGEGRVVSRGVLPEAPCAVHRCEDALIFCLPSGLILAKSLHDGAALFRRRAGARLDAALLQGGLLLCLVRGRAEARARKPASRVLVALDAATGAPAWEQPLAGAADPRSLVPFGDRVALLCGGSVLAFRARDGAPRFSAPLGAEGFHDGAFLAVADELDDAARAAARSPRGPGLIVAGRGGAALRLDERGARIWSLPPSGDAAPFAPVVARGVVLLAREGASLHDAAEGLPLARLAEAAPRAAALSADLAVALLDASGSLHLHRLAAHLSVV
jgi:outer membrane protein assembly factor BamB